MEKLVYDLTVGVSSGLPTAALAWVANWQRSRIQGWSDKEIRRQAKLIEGQWDTTEVFTASNSQGTDILVINAKGRRVTGPLRGQIGPDQGAEFDIEGTFKDLIVSFTWTKRGSRALESGTTTAKPVRAGELEGHGLDIQPDDGKVYTSTFSAKYKP